MATIFQSVRGTVIRTDPEKTVSVMSVEGLDMSSELMLVTGISVLRGQVTQFIKTLDKMNFGYSWGEGPGDLSVSGIIFFANGCNISGESAGKINDYYEANNVYSRGKPIKIAIGAAAFSGYLESMRIDAESNEYNYGQFRLEFSSIPNN